MWSQVTFGKRAGKTLPQILVTDPDWFFWACENDVFAKEPRLQAEAFTLYHRARHIKIPTSYGSKTKVRYWRDAKRKFSHIDIIEPTEPVHMGSSSEIRAGYLDLSVPRKMNAHDKVGNKLMIQCFKKLWFGSGNLTKYKVEGFFSDPSNFGTSSGD